MYIPQFPPGPHPPIRHHDKGTTRELLLSWREEPTDEQKRLVFLHACEAAHPGQRHGRARLLRQNRAQVHPLGREELQQLLVDTKILHAREARDHREVGSHADDGGVGISRKDSTPRPCLSFIQRPHRGRLLSRDGLPSGRGGKTTQEQVLSRRDTLVRGKFTTRGAG
jgi:hypothetical protein